MATWGEFAAQNPELAAFGEERFFAKHVAYLATVRRKDGGPRVHPVTPIIGHGYLFLFMFDTSPKGKDLKADGRYAMHAMVEDANGGNGEFLVHGTATYTEDPQMRKLAVDASSYAPRDEYILFVLDIDYALGSTYDGDEPVRRRWRASGE